MARKHAAAQTISRNDQGGCSVLHTSLSRTEAVSWLDIAMLMLFLGLPRYGLKRPHLLLHGRDESCLRVCGDARVLRHMCAALPPRAAACSGDVICLPLSVGASDSDSALYANPVLLGSRVYPHLFGSHRVQIKLASGGLL